MKIKEIKRTANTAWSPKPIYPLYIAAGTAAQQLDATFSTSAALEIYHVDFSSNSLDMPVAGCMPSEHRFHKLLWTDYGSNEADHPNGMILGGTDDGKICVIDAATVLSGDHELSLLDTLADHSGPVQALDMNNFQHNLIASGASDSEIFIWDLRNPETPLTPGTKTTPPDQISCLAWNKQVQHILASSSQTGRVVIWDLRKSEPIIKVGDQSAMFHYKSMAWHPSIATQILIGNEDDRYPVIQMWDLRYATSPMKVFEGHSRGVLSLDWCPQDPDLLMSCGKDNRILCWNPNTEAQNGEIIYELPTSAQWTSDVKWCPRNPGLVSTTAFDGHITISTLMGGSMELHQEQRNQISDSFGITQDASIPPQPTTMRVEPLKTPPKWMRKPCGARFCFGGKLISCDNTASSKQQIHLSQVVTETEFLNRSNALEKALINGQLVEFCDTKIETETDPKEKLLWQFLKSNFHNEPRMQFLNLLGYNPDEIAGKVSALLAEREAAPPAAPPAEAVVDEVTAPPQPSIGIDAAELSSRIEQLDMRVDGENLADECGFISPPVDKTPDSDDLVHLSEGSPDLLTAGTVVPESTPQELNLNSGPGAVLFESTAADPFASSEGTDLFNAIADGTITDQQDEFSAIAAAAAVQPEPVVEEQEVAVVPEAPIPKFAIPTDNEVDGLICQALLAGNFEVAVDVCFSNNRTADSLLLAIAGGPDLFARTQKRYLEQSQNAVSKIINAIVNRDWRSVVENAAIENWKEALSTLVTYSKAEEFSELCCNLGERLENESQDYNGALLCYICAGNVERMIACWTKSADGGNPSPLVLQNLIEKMMVLKKSVESEQQPVLSSDSHVAKQLSNYASLLSSQGNLQTALVYLSCIDGEGVAVLKDRVFRAHGGIGGRAPDSPFQKVDVQLAQKPITPSPLQERPPSLKYSAAQPAQVPQPGIPSYSQPAPAPEDQYYPNSSSYYNPSVSSYNTTVSQPSYQTPAPPQPNIYQPPPPTHGGNRTPVGAPPPGMMNPSYQAPPVPSSQPSNMYNPGLHYNPPAPTSVPQPTPTPHMFNPAANMSHDHSAPPSDGGLHSPSIMKPLPPPTGMNPPPPTSGNIMSMRAVKEEQKQNIQPAVMNFYNPGAVQQPEMNGHVGMPSIPGATTLPPQTQVPPQQPKAEPTPAKTEIVKGPIPEEHIILQQVFDGMIERCRGATRNPQSKRKLDEVRRKLDVLYDLLRVNGVSQNVLNGLHQMSTACQSSDYLVGIQIHTQMITTGNFSEISSFMPGLKTLMQISGTLKV